MAQVAIITASDSGIGKECALLLAQQGFDPEHREGDQDPQDPEQQQEQETHHADRGRAGSYCKHASPLLHRLDFMTQPRLGFVSQRKPWHVV